MKVSTIQSVYYNKNYLATQKQQFRVSESKQLSHPAFRGDEGAGVGSAAGTAAVAWIAGAALAATGPIALVAGLFAGFAAGGAVGHGVQELANKIIK